MKKLVMLLVMMGICGSVFASGQRPPKGTYADCNWQVEQTATKAGVKSPWDGGDNAKWYEATHEAYNQCRCRFYGKPFPNGVDKC